MRCFLVISLHSFFPVYTNTLHELHLRTGDPKAWFETKICCVARTSEQFGHRYVILFEIIHWLNEDQMKLFLKYL